MALDRGKLREVLAGLRAGGSGAGPVYGTYLDRLPRLFGSAKLAGEADLILAALAACEQAHAAAAEAMAPTGLEPCGQDAAGLPLFRPTGAVPVGGLEEDWLGAPLYALAVALGRTRERQSVDDEAYSAGFVYVLFRLKAALGVWRGDAAPDARYRLWLKDLAPVIAAHPRLGPKVRACHGVIARAVFEACEAYLPALHAGGRVAEPAVFAAFATTAGEHARLGRETGSEGGGKRGSEDVAEANGTTAEDTAMEAEHAAALSHVAEVLRRAGLDTRQRGLAGRAVRLHSAEIALLGNMPSEHGNRLDGSNMSAPWHVAACHSLAAAYVNRGNAKQDAADHGPGTAIRDYDRAIELREALRAELELYGKWSPELRDGLANAYMSRGNAKRSATGHGPGAALGDYDQAVEVREALRRDLEPCGEWAPELRDGLAMAYTNRGNAKQFAAGHGLGAAIRDYDRAIEFREALRAELEPRGAWEVGLRDGLAGTYMNRGHAKESATGHGPGAAIRDYDRAVEITDALRLELEPRGAWDPALRATLAKVHVNRGNAKYFVVEHGATAAVYDYDRAVEIMNVLRRELEPRGEWGPELRDGLAMAYMNRGNAKQKVADHGPRAAIHDYDRAVELREALRRELEPRGEWGPELRSNLAMAHVNRGLAWEGLTQNEAACMDGRAAWLICHALDATYGADLRIASSESLPAVDPLPHLTCSLPVWNGGGEHEAGEHGDA